MSKPLGSSWALRVEHGVDGVGLRAKPQIGTFAAPGRLTDPGTAQRSGSTGAAVTAGAAGLPTGIAQTAPGVTTAIARHRADSVRRRRRLFGAGMAVTPSLTVLRR